MNLKEAIRDVLGVREQPGDEWQCFCFSPEHDNRNTPSASVNVRKGLWVCYSCGRGGSVVSLLSGVQIADPSVSEYLSDVEADLRRLEQSAHQQQTRLPEAYLRLYTSNVHPAWVERGFSQQAIDYFSLGYDYETDCLTYPLRDLDGSLLGVVRRRLDGGRPKYLYPKGFDVHDLLFRYHEAPHGDTLILVEGALDSIALYDAGLFALAIYGGHLSEVQLHLLARRNPKLVILAFDNDEAGEDLVTDVMTTDLPLVTEIKTVDWTGVSAKDVAELSVEERIKLIDGAVDIVA